MITKAERLGCIERKQRKDLKLLKTRMCRLPKLLLDLDEKVQALDIAEPVDTMGNVLELFATAFDDLKNSLSPDSIACNAYNLENARHVLNMATEELEEIALSVQWTDRTLYRYVRQFGREAVSEEVEKCEAVKELPELRRWVEYVCTEMEEEQTDPLLLLPPQDDPLFNCLSLIAPSNQPPSHNGCVCVICRTNAVNWVLPCGHVLCETCCRSIATATTDEVKCHICTKVNPFRKGRRLFI